MRKHLDIATLSCDVIRRQHTHAGPQPPHWPARLPGPVATPARNSVYPLSAFPLIVGVSLCATLSYMRAAGVKPVKETTCRFGTPLSLMEGHPPQCALWHHRILCQHSAACKCTTAVRIAGETGRRTTCPCISWSEDCGFPACLARHHASRASKEASLVTEACLERMNHTRRKM